MLTKTTKLLSILVFTSLLTLMPILAFAQEESEWTIKKFHSDIIIDANSKIDVTEKIVADFFVDKHGIFRYIPVKYKDNFGQNQNIKLDLISIKDENGNKHKYSTSYSSGNIKFKIGDSNKTITGENTYIINYKINKAINYFDDYDELYWNVTGNDWPVKIEKASASVNLSSSLNKDEIQTKLYTGSYGSTKENGTINIDNSNIIYTSNQELSSKEGLTIVAGWPKGITREPTALENLWQTLINNIFYFLPIIVFFVLLWQYFKHGKDPKGRGTIVPEFAVPKNLTPLEMGAIVDEKIDNRDISASIIDLAIRKYLKIEIKEKKGLLGTLKETTLKKLPRDSKDLNNFEKELINGLFDGKDEIKIKDLKKFYTTASKVKDQVFKKMTKNEYFPKHPTHVKAIYFITGMILLFVSFFSFGFSISFAIGTLLSGIIFMVFGPFMPKKTLKGVALREKILGLKLYLKTAEKYRLEFQEKSQIFERFLPAAMALGVATIWAKKFKNIYQNTKPHWCHGYPGYLYVPTALASDLNSMRSQISQTMSSASSGGSGFSGGGSGGGFGGGGGGSW